MCRSGSSKKTKEKTPEPQPVSESQDLTPTSGNGGPPSKPLSPLPESLAKIPVEPPLAKTNCPPPLPPPPEDKTPAPLHVDEDTLPEAPSKPVAVQRERSKHVDQALLKVKLHLKNDPSHVFGAATVKSTLAGSRQTTMDTGIADFGAVPTGKHVITVTLQGDAAKKYTPPKNPVEQPLGNGDNVTVPIELEPLPWTLKVTVESTTAFGWPKDDVTIDFPGSSVASQKLKMTAKTGDVTVTGTDDAVGTAKAAAADWTLEKQEPIALKSGDSKTLTLKLKGIDEAFELLDAGSPPAPVKNEKVTLLREDGSPVPNAPDKTDDKGMVKLTNVPPEKYKIKFPDRYDAEWEFDKAEDLT